MVTIELVNMKAKIFYKLTAIPVCHIKTKVTEVLEHHNQHFYLLAQENSQHVINITHQAVFHQLTKNPSQKSLR